jgi:hypothetical protein
MSDDPAALLRAYDLQLRAHIAATLPPRVVVDHDGPVTRITGYGPGGWVEYHDLGGLEGASLDQLIAPPADRSYDPIWAGESHPASL